MTRLGTLLVEKPRVFNGNTRLAGEDAHELEMSFIKDAFVFGKNSHRADGMIVSDEWNSTEAAVLENGLDAEFFDFGCIVFADQHRLSRPNNVFGEIVASRPAARRPHCAFRHFYVELHFITKRVKRTDVKILDVKEAPQFFPNFAQEIFLVERGTQGAANLVEDVQLLGPARCLLDEITIFNGHADLVAKREKQTVLSGSKAAAV